MATLIFIELFSSREIGGHLFRFRTSDAPHRTFCTSRPDEVSVGYRSPPIHRPSSPAVRARTPSSEYLSPAPPALFDRSRGHRLSNIRYRAASAPVPRSHCAGPGADDLAGVGISRQTHVAHPERVGGQVIPVSQARFGQLATTCSGADLSSRFR